MMRRWRSYGALLLFLLCLVLYLPCSLFLQHYRVKHAFQSSSLVLVLPPAALKILAGEFRGVLVDKIILDIGSFLGSKQKPTRQDWDNIIRSLEQVMALDPRFQQTYMLVQGYIPWDAGEPRKANELLDLARKARPYDWRPGYYIGFNAYYFLHDYAKASASLLAAARIKNAPVLLAVLGARFADQAGSEETALLMLRTILGELQSNQGLSEEEKSHRIKEIKDRITALQGVWLLKKAIAGFHRQYGFYPFSLDYLVYKGFLWRIPDNPYDTNYYYRFEDGTVAFDAIRGETGEE